MRPISLMEKPILYFDHPTYRQDELDEKKLLEKYLAFDLSRACLIEEKVTVKKLRASTYFKLRISLYIFGWYLLTNRIILEDISRAAKTYEAASVNDPITVYVRDTPVSSSYCPSSLM